MEKNKKENKIILFTTLGIIGAIIIVLGITYAYWRLTKEQTGVNIVNSACLNVTMENQLNDINLENAYPIVDSDGLKLEPFTFTLKNNCEEYADYTISLEMLSITDLNSDFVKIALNEQGVSGTPKILGSYDEYADLKLEDTVEGRTITSGKLEPNGEKNYELRIWLDEDVTVDDDAMNKTYKSKVVIESTIGEEPKLLEKICNEKPESIDCQLLKKDENNEEPELMYDDTEDKNLRYVGANPNNYINIGDNKYEHDIYKYGDDIWFEDDNEYNSLEECESNPEHLGGTCKLLHKQGEQILWRIIGVMKNVYNVETGQEEDLIKIIRADSIGRYSWDTSQEKINNGEGVNEWSQADLMKLLNPSYSDNRDSICVEEAGNSNCSSYSENQLINNSLYWNNERGQCYSYSSNSNEACDFTNIGISEEAKSKIAKVRWNTGTFATNDELDWATHHDTAEWTASSTYKAERSENNGKQYCLDQGGGSGCNDEVERTTTWDGYIGLVNPSDYGYAVGKSARDECLAESMADYNKGECSSADWLAQSVDYWREWTLNPVPHYDDTSHVFRIVQGRLAKNFASGDLDVRPVLYLKSNVTITDASGTLEDPFVAS